MNKIRVGVLGATGYAGVELVRLLSNHPDVEITYIVSHSYVGKKISEVYPHLKGVCDLVCSDLSNETAKHEFIHLLQSTDRKYIFLQEAVAEIASCEYLDKTTTAYSFCVA